MSARPTMEPFKNRIDATLVQGLARQMQGAGFEADGNTVAQAAFTLKRPGT